MDRIRNTYTNTNSWYSRWNRAEDIAERYMSAIRSEMRKRASANEVALSANHAQQLRDINGEENAMLPRNIYDRNASTAAKGNIGG